MHVLLIGTLDTKAAEIGFVGDLLRRRGLDPFIVDASVLGDPPFRGDIEPAEVFEAAGTTLAAVRKTADRGQAITLAANGAARIARMMAERGEIAGVLALGGSAGTSIGTAAMRALPFGIPKLMVSTMASGDVRPYVGVSDILMMHSVVDISGLNRISRTVLTNAANAIVGMVKGEIKLELRDERGQGFIGATMFGVTTPCVETARRLIEASGYETLIFHATGTGGRTMESFISSGLITGVLDLTTTELADELVGGVLSAGPDRLTAAAIKGIPQVISLGALDMVNFGPPESISERFRSRRLYRHNPNVTLMRTTPEENDALGREIAQKASAAHGPTAIVIPLRGVSAIDRAGQPFWWPEADAALFQSLRNWMAPQVQLVELDMHINDAAFAETAARILLDMINGSSG